MLPPNFKENEKNFILRFYNYPIIFNLHYNKYFHLSL